MCEKTAILSQQHGLMGLFLFLFPVDRNVLEIWLLVRKDIFLSLPFAPVKGEEASFTSYVSSLLFLKFWLLQIKSNFQTEAQDGLLSPHSTSSALGSYLPHPIYLDRRTAQSVKCT